jgi:hypothetical protein
VSVAREEKEEAQKAYRKKSFHVDAAFFEIALY